MVLSAGLTPRAAGQSEEEVWSAPVNLSRSGAAEQPYIIAAPDGTLQAFWWDRFDGVTTSIFDGARWSNPQLAPILVTVEERGTFVSEPIGAMPMIVEDPDGWVHAFWWGGIDPETGTRPLEHSHMPIRDTLWSQSTVLADSAVAFHVAATPRDTPHSGLSLAYVHTAQGDGIPAGVYAKSSGGGGAGWSPSFQVYDSVYFRLLTEEVAYVRVSDAGDNNVHLVWEDPHLGQALYARSSDDGATWTGPQPLGEADETAAQPRVFALPGGEALRMWQTGAGCTLVQQRRRPNETPIWSSPEQVLEGLSVCPSNERTWAYRGGQLWLWGEGTGTLSLTVWDPAAGLWTEPQDLAFRFQDPATERWIGLSDLHATLAGGTLAVVGSDAVTGEVWVTTAQMEALQLAFASPSPWSQPVRLSPQGVEAGQPAVAIAPDGGVHLVWSESPEAGAPGTALFHARWEASASPEAEEGSWSRAVEVAGAASEGEMARQPALLADAQGVLHLVWSGGEQGEILYSRAQADQASAPGAWSEPQPLPAPAVAGSWPQIGQDAAGHLYVLYAVPLNEGRGIYLSRSEDGGEAWSGPEPVFDATAAGWAMVDHPALAVGPDGALHAAWVEATLPGTWPPKGVVYAHRAAGEAGWTKPVEVAVGGYDWPRLGLAAGEIHLLYFRAEDGSFWHRRTDAEGGGNGWGTPMRISGMEAAAAPVGLAVSGSPVNGPATVYLVGADRERGILLYTTWDGVRWDAVETLSLEPEGRAGLGAAAATLASGGNLAVGLLALADDPEGGASSAVLSAARTISTVNAALLPTPLPTVRPVFTPSPSPEPTAAPSPTPDITSSPPASAFPLPPLYLGAGLAGFIVVGALLAWGIRRRGSR